MTTTTTTTMHATTNPIDAEAGTTANNRLTSYLRFVSKKLTNIAASSPSSSSSSLMTKDGVRPRLHFVLGNEAGDADSIISALCYAYVLYSQRQTNSLYFGNNNDDDDEEWSTTLTGTENDVAVIVVPIVSIPRSEIKLRPDVVRLLDLAGIDIRDLICIDDEFIISTLLLATRASSSTSSTTTSAATSEEAATSSPIIPRSKKQQVCLILVDHNRLRSSLSHLSNNVIEIMDHHEDELCYFDTVVPPGSSGSGSSKRNIAFQDGAALVASTCTLVVERLFNITPTTTTTSSGGGGGGGGDGRNRSCSSTASATEKTAVPTTTTIDANLGLLLLGVILLDSVNMNIDAGKGTARDEFAISLLYRYTNWSSNNKVDDNNNNDDDDRTIATATIYPPNGCANVPPNRDALFAYLQRAKFDNTFWHNLSVTDCFKLDYKKFTIPNMDSSSSTSSSSSISIGLSTVLISMSELLAKPNFYNELSSFVTTTSSGGGVDNTNDDDEMLLLGIQTMTFSDDDDDDDDCGLPIRGLLLAGTDDSILESYTNYLITSEDAKFLEFTEIIVDDCDGGNDWWKKKKKPEEDEECTTTTSNSSSEAAAGSISVRIFQQGNGKGSRKQVAPTLLKHASAKWGGGGRSNKYNDE